MMTTIDRAARDCRDIEIGFERLPVRERILDRLADLMLDTDDILEVLEAESAGDLRSIAPEIRDVFDRVNRLMERLSD